MVLWVRIPPVSHLKVKKMFKRIANYLSKAVRSNTGVSTLSLICVTMGVMSVIILVVICICMLVEVFTTHTITSSLDGYAAIIGAIAGLVTAVGIPKAINNYSENKYRKPPKSEDSD